MPAPAQPTPLAPASDTITPVMQSDPDSALLPFSDRDDASNLNFTGKPMALDDLIDEDASWDHILIVAAPSADMPDSERREIIVLNGVDYDIPRFQVTAVRSAKDGSGRYSIETSSRLRISESLANSRRILEASYNPENSPDGDFMVQRGMSQLIEVWKLWEDEKALAKHMATNTLLIDFPTEIIHSKLRPKAVWQTRWSFAQLSLTEKQNCAETGLVLLWKNKALTLEIYHTQSRAWATRIPKHAKKKSATAVSDLALNMNDDSKSRNLSPKRRRETPTPLNDHVMHTDSHLYDTTLGDADPLNAMTNTESALQLHQIETLKNQIKHYEETITMHSQSIALRGREIDRWKEVAAQTDEKLSISLATNRAQEAQLADLKKLSENMSLRQDELTADLQKKQLALETQKNLRNADLEFFEKQASDLQARTIRFNQQITID